MDVADDKVDLAIGLLSDLAGLPLPEHGCTCKPCKALQLMHRGQAIKIASNLQRDLERIAAVASMKRAAK